MKTVFFWSNGAIAGLSIILYFKETTTFNVPSYFDVTQDIESILSMEIFQVLFSQFIR